MSALKTNLNTLWQQVPLAPVFLALAGGICAADRVQLNPLWLMLPGIGLLFISVLRGLGKGREPTLPLLLVTFFLAAASFSLWRQVHFPRWLDGLLQTRTIDLTGQVVALRQAPPFLAELEIDSVNQRPLPGGAQLRFQFRPHAQGTLPFQEGQRLRLKQVKLTPLSAPRNPGAFNYRRYLKLRGISARLEAGRQSSWEVIAPSRHTLLERCTGLIRRARQAFGTRLDRLLPPEASAFYRALLLGQREFLSRSLLRDYQNAGVIHVLAISGLHVGFLAVIFYLALSFLPLSFKKRNLCVILLLLVYMVLVGSRPPVVRATVMAGLILLAQNLERKHSTLNAFFAAGCLILVFAPAQLFWVGFQLSFAAVAAILIGLPLLERRLLYRWLERPLGRSQKLVLHLVMRPLLVTVAAQLGTLPLTVIYFHRLALISFFLNLVVIPWIGLLVLLGLVMLATSFVYWLPAAMVGGFASFLIHRLNGLVQGAAALPIASVPASPALLGWFALGIATTFLVKLSWSRSRRLAWLLGMVALALITDAALRPGPLQLLLLDVGQGQALLLRLPSGRTYLFDAGPADPYFDAGRQVVVPVAQYLRIRRIQGILISHPHRDHMGGLFSILQQLPVDSVYWPVMPVNLPEVEAMKAACRNAGTGWRALRAGQRLSLDPQTRLYVLNPLPALLRYREPTAENVNNNSLVLLIKHGPTSILLTGDVEQDTEAQLLAWDGLLDCDLLQVPHHGSHTSSTTVFLRATSPQIGLLSVGKNNRFGLPDSAIVQRLRRWMPLLYRTDRQGAVWLRYAPGSGRWQLVQWHPRANW